MAFSTIFVILAALLFHGYATENSTSRLECDKTGKCEASKKFNQLLDATLLMMGLHKYNQTILADAKRNHQVPMVSSLYIAGSGVAGSAGVRRAQAMTKDPNLYVFTWTGQLRSGNILFTLGTTTWQNSIVATQTSLVRETGWCTKCGADADLAIYQEPGATPLAGPTSLGLFAVTVDLEVGHVSYRCTGDNCWPHNEAGAGPDLFVVGPSLCGNWTNLYRQRRGPQMIPDPEQANLYRVVVHMCPDRNQAGWFKIARREGTWSKSLKMRSGAFEEEESSLEAKGGTGYMTQFQGENIRGPTVEADYEVTVDMTAGTVEYHCIGLMCNGPNAGPSYYVPVNQVHEKGQAFVHLFGWRWPDIALECETFLGPKGYKGVQIAPPQESKTPRPGRPDSWNYVYRPVSYRLASRLGSEAEFIEMIERCQLAGVDIYADAVLNQMGGGTGERPGSGGTNFGPRTFPDVGYGSFMPEDFHHTGTDTTVNCDIRDSSCDHNCEHVCDFNGMPDLDTSSPKVQEMQAAYLNHLLSLGVAGFRIDAADHIETEDLTGILTTVEPKFRFFETRDADDMDNKMALGRVTQFGYKNKLMRYIMQGRISRIQSLGVPQGLVPGEEAVVFVLNHDSLMIDDANGQGVTYRTPVEYTLGNVVMLALPYGYPKVLSSYYFPEGQETYPPPALNVHGDQEELRCGDNQNWVCEHRWPSIANMVRWRNYAGNNTIDLWESASQSQVYFCRGHEACILINVGPSSWSVTPALALAPGDYCNIIESDDGAVCPKIRVDEAGNAHTLNSDGSSSEIVVPAMGTVALHVGAIASA